MKERPLFSVVICVDERVDFVLPTIKSIYQQAYPHIEVLVYYCDPDLNENTLITPLQKLPVHDNIRVLVEKTEMQIRRSEGIRRCMEWIHGDVVVFTKENTIFSSVDTIDTIMSCFERESHIDAMLLPNTLKGPIEIRPPYMVLADQLLFNQSKRLPVFRTDTVRELLNDLPKDIFELLPEYMLLTAEKAGRAVKCCPSRKAAIVQKAVPGNAMNYHLHKRDALLLLDKFFLQDMLLMEFTDETEKIETYYAKLNYYCALYNVPKIETAQEIKQLELEQLRKKYAWYKENYCGKKVKKSPVASGAKKQPKRKVFDKTVEKIDQTRWQIGSILLLMLNFLIVKIVLFPDSFAFAQYVLLGGWIIVFALFVYACVSKLRLKLQKLKKWLNS